MAPERTVEKILVGLLAQAAQLWGEADAEQQRQGLQQTAEQILTMYTYALPADLEPRFF